MGPETVNWGVVPGSTGAEATRQQRSCPTGVPVGLWCGVDPAGLGEGLLPVLEGGASQPAKPANKTHQAAKARMRESVLLEVLAVIGRDNHSVAKGPASLSYNLTGSCTFRQYTLVARVGPGRRINEQNAK